MSQSGCQGAWQRPMLTLSRFMLCFGVPAKSIIFKPKKKMVIDNDFEIALLQLPLAAALIGVRRGLLSYE